ncbi:YraN family protein [uncultured Desulfovibrio sp.]|uniref:YraN family protein n=1 Tax=uncultured Desulfovibrio sp. TaxID=167968 RepID=UPI00262092C9|nr:YraN family protein [uncultured Desulfovibrio sp.]
MLKPPAQAATSAAQARAALGQRGEAAAAALLQRRGYVLLDQNWRQGRLELDIVCRDGDTLVFVEVKSRRAHTQAGPADAMTPRKRRTLVRAAQYWLDAHAAWHRPCRFDVVTVIEDAQGLHLEHLPHAFDFTSAGDPVDCGHTAWQPW